jgi:preprotein translocase subunit SecB
MVKISINDIRLKSILFDINDNYKGDLKNINFRFKLFSESRYDNNNQNLYLVFGIGTIPSERDDEYPFLFEIKSRAIFKLSENVEKSELDKIIKINCPAIIFPYIRETVADITRRAGFPALHLAPMNFVSEYEKSCKLRSPSSQKLIKKSDATSLGKPKPKRKSRKS